MAVKQKTHQPCYEGELEAINSQLPQLRLEQKLADAMTFSLCESPIYSQTPPDRPPPDRPPPDRPPPTPPPSAAPPPEAPPPQPNPPPNPPQPNEPPQLEGQPNVPTIPTPVEQLLEPPPLSYSERLDRLMQLLQERKEASPESDNSQELGTILAKPTDELGTILVIPREEEVPPPVERQPPLPPEKPVAQFKPIGYLRAYVGFFETNNIFSSEVDPIEDGLIFSGLTLATAPIALGPKTYLNAGIDGNLIFYIDQSKYNYNQVRFNLSIYQQLSRRMYGELGLSNQQLFYAKNGDFFSAGDRFLNENSVRLSLGRRDPLTQRLMLDSFYELRLSFADPESRSRVINSLWVSLNYYWLRSLQVGLDYQFNLSDFTQRQREDQYHRLYAHLTYGISDYTNISLQGGITFGDSTDQNINFDGWFFSVNYNWELGQF